MPIVEIVSPMMKTPLDASNANGYHNCKILSPARALEFIYVDSLKPQ